MKPLTMLERIVSRSPYENGPYNSLRCSRYNQKLWGLWTPKGGRRRFAKRRAA